MKEVLTTREANEIVFNQAREELTRSLKTLSDYAKKLESPNFDDFASIVAMSWQVMRESSVLFGLTQSAWLESESKRPMTPLEQQLEEARKKVGDDN
jgi:hypothetical protein